MPPPPLLSSPPPPSDEEDDKKDEDELRSDKSDDWLEFSDSEDAELFDKSDDSEDALLISEVDERDDCELIPPEDWLLSPPTLSLLDELECPSDDSLTSDGWLLASEYPCDEPLLASECSRDDNDESSLLTSEYDCELNSECGPDDKLLSDDSELASESPIEEDELPLPELDNDVSPSDEDDCDKSEDWLELSGSEDALLISETDERDDCELIPPEVWLLSPPTLSLLDELECPSDDSLSSLTSDGWLLASEYPCDEPLLASECSRDDNDESSLLTSEYDCELNSECGPDDKLLSDDSELASECPIEEDELPLPELDNDVIPSDEDDCDKSEDSLLDELDRPKEEEEELSGMIVRFYFNCHFVSSHKS